jgi:hypothetical protein
MEDTVENQPIQTTQPEEEKKAPVEKKKRELTEKQRQALAKARLARAVKAEQKKTQQQQQQQQQEEETFNFSSTYLLGTAVLGLSGLAGYYFLKQQQSSNEFQKSLEEKLQKLQNNIPKTIVQKEIFMQPEKEAPPPQIIEKHTETIREVQPVEPQYSAEQLRKQQLFRGAKEI